MLKKILFFGLIASLIGCEADIPELTTGVSAEGYAKTADYPLSNGDAHPVNPIGLNVGPAVENSNGVVSMELSGAVPCGIPPALQEIVDGNTQVQTDYPYHHTKWNTPAEDLYYYTDNPDPSDPTKGNHDKPLENMISLKALSSEYNSQYAAVTLTLPNIGAGVTVDETNDSLKLLTEKYYNEGSNARYDVDANNMPWHRSITYSNNENPNYFAYVSADKYTNNQIEYPTPGGPDTNKLNKGGMSFLIWKGGKQNATVKANNQTIKFDWSRVNFKSEPLIYAAWYPLPSTIISLDPATDPPNGNNPLPDFHYKVTVPIGNASTGAWVDNFITPSFYPENSTEKRVTLATTRIETTPANPEDEGGSYITVSLADRIRLEFYNVAAGTYSDTQIATIYTSNTDPYFQQITLYLAITITSPPVSSP